MVAGNQNRTICGLLDVHAEAIAVAFLHGVQHSPVFLAAEPAITPVSAAMLGD